MFQHHPRAPQEIVDLRVAAVQLFGRQQAASREFWKNLDLATLKKAFREKARLYHPDLYRQSRPETLKAKQERFIAISRAYEVLRRFLGADLFQKFD